MQILWAPWRMEYILDERKRECIFCLLPGEGDDRKSLILYRGNKVFVIMNRYPYTNGHLMVSPLRHEGSLERLEAEEMRELFEMIRECVIILKKEFYPDGFNIGMNLGRVAGAGVEDHLHFHIVPRWSGDTNFMPVLADVKVMPEFLEVTYERLKPHFDKLKC